MKISLGETILDGFALNIDHGARIPCLDDPRDDPQLISIFCPRGEEKRGEGREVLDERCFPDF